MDISQPLIAASGQLAYNDLSDDIGHRSSVSFGGRFGDDKFGAMITLAYSDKEIRQDTLTGRVWIPQGFDIIGVGADDGTDVDLTAVRPSNTPREVFTQGRERLGISGATVGPT